MFKLTKKKVAAGLVAAGMLASTGIAYAYWTATGSGSGGATTASSISVTLTGDAVTGLFPGADPVDITGTVDVSDGATSAYIGTITPVIKEGVGGTSWNHAVGHPACSADDYDLQSADIDDQVADGSTGVAFGTIQLKDTTDDQDNCKGQVLVLSFSSN